MKFKRKFVLTILNSLPKSLKWKLFLTHKIGNRIKINFRETRRNLFHNHVKVVVIGANDGISFDDLFQFLNPRNSSGLLIEPAGKYFSLLKKNLTKFKGFKFLNVAITSSKEEVKLYQLNENGLGKLPLWGKGLGSFSKYNLLKFEEISDDDIEEEIVKGFSFMEIIQTYSLFEIDYLQIDTEGYDGKIIQMIDFYLFNTKMIKYEWVNLDPFELDECNRKLKKFNFFLTKEGEDIIGYSKEVNPIFI